jgi:hypothetical protein
LGNKARTDNRLPASVRNKTYFIVIIMKATKEELIRFLEENVLTPAENHPKSDLTIKRKVRTTRMRLNRLANAEKVEEFFWHAMSTDNGIDSYTKISRIGALTFEDVRFEFKIKCGRK